MDKRVIFLTAWPAMTIKHADWPVQVVALDYSQRGEYTLRVREHRDGRTIVYGTHGSHITGETYAAAGELLEADCDIYAVVDAMRRVGVLCRAPGSLISSAIRDLSVQFAA